MGALGAYRGLSVFGLEAPHERPGVRLVLEDGVNRRRTPLLPAAGCEPLAVQGPCDIAQGHARCRHLEDAPDHGVHRRVEGQPWAALPAVIDVLSAVADRGRSREPESAAGRFAHAADHILSHVSREKLVEDLDHPLRESAGGRVVCLFLDRGDLDAPLAEQGLVHDGVFAVPGEPRELPDEDLIEGAVVRECVSDHPLERRALRRPPALCLVDVRAHNRAPVLLRVVLHGLDLRGDREVDVLADARDSGVDREAAKVLLILHCRFLSCWFACTANLPPALSPSVILAASQSHSSKIFHSRQAATERRRQPPRPP